VEECDELGLVTSASAAGLVASVGEPVVATYGRAEVEAVLRSAAFNRIELLDSAELSRRYLQGGDEPVLPRSTVIAVATA
jgi:hypothetical protein